MSSPPDNFLTTPDVFVTKDVLMAVIAPAGARPESVPLAGFFKLAADTALTIRRSTVEYINGGGEILETFHNAFQLQEGTHLAGLYSGELIHDSRRPENAALVRWHINEFTVEAPLTIPAQQGNIQQVIYLPLQIALEKDQHVIVNIVNTGTSLLNIAGGVRGAIYRVDGTPFESVAGRAWNGVYQLRPGTATLRRFRLSDFPGSPREGAHQVSLEMFGEKSETRLVNWRGQPWMPL